jgi:hypothetical protein
MSYEPSCRGYGDMEVRSGAEGTETGARRPVRRRHPLMKYILRFPLRIRLCFLYNVVVNVHP